MNHFVIADAKNCIGCRTCEVACAIAHSDNSGPEGLSSSDFYPRIKVIVGAKISTAVLCHQCEDAPCAEVCPNGAIVREHNSIQVIQNRCIGCKTCALACPYGVMNVVTRTVAKPSAVSLVSQRTTVEAQKCDLCIGQESGPSCVSVCPTGALRLVTADALDAMMRHRQEQAVLNHVLQ